MGHNRNLADYAHHFDGTHIDLGSGNIETQGVLTYEDVTNVDAIGIVTARAGVKVPDNQKVFLGTGDDLQIYHDGSHSYIDDAGTGNLYLRSGTLPIQNLAGSKTSAVFNSGGGQELYHNNSKKFETTTTGATVTGTLVSDGVTSELDLSAISSSISDTANDVFVYDTRKDSDGGAWRKRTQHTSWYNETLNTSTRGSRKEFPAVAVIVSDVSTDKVTIYDGDDPDLPMWMVISGANPRGILGWATTNITSIKVTALNGILVLGTNDSGTIFKFVEDFVEIMYSSANYQIKTSRTIAGRNDTPSYDTVSGTASRVFVIVNYIINDVAMTVLPNAPIDSATGLPVPTIAVATNGGVSVIKDDGNVVSKTTTQLNSNTLNTSYYHKNIDINGENAIVNYEYAGGGGHGQLMVATLNDLTVLRRYGRDYTNTTSSHPYFQPIGSRHRHFPKQIYKNNYIFTREQNDSAVNGASDGILTIYEDQTAPSNGLINRISSSYNTGWMHGDIKGAFLSDTDATNVTATDLTTNGSFTTDSDWTKGEQWTISGGSASITDSPNRTTDSLLTQSISGLQEGKSYIATVTWSTSTGDFDLTLGGSATRIYSIASTYGASGTRTFNITAASSDTLFGIVANQHLVGSFDSISLKLAEQDRSVNNKGLEVFGTVTKSAVATGAELVAYSGFTASNYLRHTTTINYGNAATITMGGWSKITAAAVDANYHYLCSVKSGSEVLGLSIHIDQGGSNAGKPYFYDVTNSSLQSDGPRVDDNQWHHILGVLDGGSKKIYIDGELIVSATVTGINLSAVDITNVGHYVSAGNNTPSYNHGGYLALIKFSASAPTAEQVKKMYEDEKMFFQENAKCTLYGSSDDVTTLGYDEDTELLHVGTSAGRSDFQGLRRINNTTTAVTTAISASDELIAEQ